MPNHTSAVKTLTGRDVVMYELAKWAQKLYGLNVQLGAGMYFVMETIYTCYFLILQNMIRDGTRGGVGG